MCETIDLGQGNFAIICGVRKPAKCQFCKARPHTRLCDFFLQAEGKTCDARMCDKCTTRGGQDLDHCPNHTPGHPLAAPARPEQFFPATWKKLKEAGWKFIYARPCKLCGKQLEFWQTPKKKPAPLEAMPDDPDHRRISHFTTCPHADKFRKPNPQGALFDK
jgi:hypothetical protein